MPLNLICIYLIISIFATIFFSTYIRSKATGDYVSIIFLLCIAIDCYMFGYILELTSFSLSQKLFWNYFEYLGIPFVSALWLTVALMYTNHFYRHRNLKLALIYLIPIQTFLLRFTNDLHHLYFTSFQLEYMGKYSLLVKTGGIGYEIQGYHSGLMILISLLIYIHAFIKSRDFSREKIIYMIGASAVACFGLLMTRSGMSIDYTVLFLPAVMVLVLLAIFRNDFLEVTMLARDMVFENSDAGIIIFNKNLKILDFNGKAEEIMKDQNIILEKKHLDFIVRNEDPLNALLKTSITNTWKSKGPYGVKYYEITTTSILRKNGAVYGTIKTFRDITAVQLHTNRLKFQATVDELSGLLNRRAFMNSCQAILNTGLTREDSYFLLMLDLDFFKRINDTFGHAAGDHVIESFGSQLKQEFGESVPSGRLGGEEFAVFFKANEIGGAFEKAEQFRRSVETSQYAFRARNLQFTVSIGIAEAKKGDDISELVYRADKALYTSKNSGRNSTSIYKKAE